MYLKNTDLRIRFIEVRPGLSTPGREESFLDQSFADFHQGQVIERQHGDGDAANGSLADPVWTVPAKMTFPLMPPRVEELRELLRLRISTGDIRPLMRVTMEA